MFGVSIVWRPFWIIYAQSDGPKFETEKVWRIIRELQMVSEGFSVSDLPFRVAALALDLTITWPCVLKIKAAALPSNDYDLNWGLPVHAQCKQGSHSHGRSKICLGQDKSWNFRFYPKLFFADGWKVKKFFNLCVKHQNVQPVGYFACCFHQSFLSILRS